MCPKVTKVLTLKVVELVMQSFTLTGRVLAILFLGLKRVMNKIVVIIMPVCLTLNLCLVSLALLNEKC